MGRLFPDEGWETEMPEDDEPLWRYIDFTQFISILEKESLWYSSAADFLDSWEGGLTEAQLDRISENVDFLDDRETFVRSVFDSLRETTFVSCWHQREGETAAMWELYNDRGKEVAIKTSVRNFREAVDLTEDMMMGCVEYINYDNDPDLFPISRQSPFFYKRESFRHESEFRSIKCEFHTPDFEEVDESYRKKVANESPAGKPITVNPEVLIDEVVVSPVVGNWMHGLVEDILERYGLSEDISVRSSKLEQNPYELNR